jgi:hypothetical protein
MKRLILAFFCIIFVTAALSARAQVAPAAYRRGLSISAGGLASAFQPDYAGQGNAQTGPDRHYGPGAFVDVRFSRWVQIEAEGRWLHYNEYLGIDQNTYLIGPRIPIRNFHGFTPYGKFLFGMGSGSFLTGRTSVFAYGGGVDYRLKRKLTLRAVDFEYQQWRVIPTIVPYGISAGISYRVF